MTEFLVFTLAAQVASFGGLAGHERRGSDTWPGRSALIGLLGAALGTRRDDADGQAALAGLSFAVGALETGAPLRDYHTVQTVPQKYKRPATRADALRMAADEGNVNTTITLRDYRCGVLYAVAAWGGGVPLETLQSALERPHYTLYLGRKSCPLSAPLAPQIVAAADPVEALGHARLPRWQSGSAAPHFIASEWPDDIAGFHHTAEWRHDEPVDRRAWHFAARQVRFLRRLGGAP
ncbi:type I-E CRISPR-associated protein Cas5/CasD [Aquibium sp. A9E412]|uniref:type I-E CRISPR-associated protein Cas5/CasD n=1 Tax=Aquibium sp. A9E412 TaxID=2976767 RepID=UPI0025B0F318|nr:type I-E CRISPR-associated protein Cas5/CasD [Aquibium sp. A9E412]MDN2565198.1 type I-E CRISPR-associated protein Cas5/CasD [Aquibium sp. A9E412]